MVQTVIKLKSISLEDQKRIFCNGNNEGFEIPVFTEGSLKMLVLKLKNLEFEFF